MQTSDTLTAEACSTDTGGEAYAEKRPPSSPNVVPKPIEGLATFLVVDDEEDILDALTRLFRRRYRVMTALSAQEALDILKRHRVHVVMTDQRMPGMTGVEFLARVKEEYPFVVRMLFTGYSDIDSVLAAINEGHVYRYISKPWNPDELVTTIKQAVEYYTLNAERNSLIHNLEQANAQLSAANRELAEANKELKLLDKLKNVFMEVVSHELNTPIAIILGYAFLLKRELSTHSSAKNIHKALSGINSSGHRLKRIADKIFKILLSEYPEVTLDYEHIETVSFLDDIYSELLPFLDKRHQTLQIEIDDRRSTIYGDRNMLHDVLINLIVNSIKFSPDGNEIALTVSVYGNDGVRITVQDQGIGIAEDDLPKVFQKFFGTFDSQHHSSGDYEFEKRGIGLGLAIVKKFVDLHGGEVSVESVVGEGSTFHVVLPWHNLAT